MRNILTVDVEEWYHTNLGAGPPDRADSHSSHLEGNVRRILDLCDFHRAKATFFVVGSVAERKPSILRMIQEAGHDIALHGYDHRLLFRQSPGEFQQDLVRSITAVEAVTGRKVRGFRAPSWSMTKQTSWAYEILERMGLEYDASMFPIGTFLYGIPDAPRFPFFPRYDGRISKVLEIPTSTVRLCGKNLPFSGGFYLRILPCSAIKAGIRRVNAEGHAAIIYIHPWEIDPEERRLDLPAKARFIQYTGLSECFRKLEGLLREFSFTSIEASLEAGALPEAYP